MSECIVLTVDAIVPYRGGIVLIRRKNEPFKGYYALPGGIVEYGESVESAVLRELKEETGLDGKIYKLVGVYSDPNRDPRGHFVSVCFIVKGKGRLKAGSDAREVGVFSLDELPELAFDHKKMIDSARGDLVGILSKM
ncbi:ADP-ribose pyrophosphatase [Archaeoglobus sulfaticallidus PM70-1]|uniref:ADP-ribose pyrophosphatase n=1 Tax=Archaeoglobus sulfaticallidus PM70-1 TaxID=387631 RepID=N0B9H8_9EURY|nr:NUDIX hydrolase [Archaeoglobus sulfaticallidus]AGK60259.1 ADP-ribose pyrophosphatase [Archaeoglobus sulfaticallidus PM70-1]